MSAPLALAALYSLAVPTNEQLEPTRALKAHLANLEAEDFAAKAERQSACPAGCTEASPVVHGDPMFKINGKGVHFWMKEGALQNLMTYKDPKTGQTLTLEGKTFSDPTDELDATKRVANQWFDEFRLKRGALTAARIYMQDGKMVTRSRGSTVPQDGEMEIVLGGLTMRIFPALASKFSNANKQEKYAHLNIDFGTALPQSATGIFAELAGIVPMSAATKATLQPAAMDKLTQLWTARCRAFAHRRRRRRRRSRRRRPRHRRRP